jgi:uncharacterized protein (DUF4415 family)
MMAKSEHIAIEADPDDAEDGDVTEAALRQALAEREVRRQVRGAQVAPTKAPVSIRFDRDLLEHYRATGHGWQARMNDDLRKLAGLPQT